MHRCFSWRQSSYFGMQKCFACSDFITENTGKNMPKVRFNKISEFLNFIKDIISSEEQNGH